MLTPAITSRSNPRVQQLRVALSRNTRLASGQIAIEGPHLILEALRSNIPLQTVFLAEGTQPPPDLPAGVEILVLSRSAFASAASTESPQGIAALILPPKRDLPLNRNPLLLLAAGLQDPGNLGTLIRSAEAFAATGVLLAPNTVSPWNQKVMRSSAGSVFRVPTRTYRLDEIAALRGAGIRLIAAVAGEGRPPAEVRLDTACALMIGNEGGGLTPELLALADEHITVPCPGPVESLNASVAGSLLLYEASRQRQAAGIQRTTAP